jgi:two-component system response regulator AlgR
MSLNVLIVDDERLARERLRTLLGDCREPAARCVGDVGDARSALALLQQQATDLLLLDIHMPGTDGLMLAQQIKALPKPPQVVFVTAHTEHALQAFELEAADYLTKPVRLERLQAALAKVSRRRVTNPSSDGQAAKNDSKANSAQAWVLLQDRGRTERLPLDHVLYFKAELKYVTVRTAQRSYILDGSLSELEQRHAAQFLRIHRNALVARHAVRALQRQATGATSEETEVWAVQLQGIDEMLVVSRRHLSAVRDAMAGL